MEFPYQQKAECIANDLRSRITNGDYTSGDRLPTRTALCDSYGVTSDTLQRALNWLIAEGFVETAGRRGTFVAERPPHLTRYALLFPNRFLPGEPTNLFNRSLYRVAKSLDDGREIRICDGFSGRAGFMEYDSLLEDVRQNRLAGLIFATAPFTLDGTPLLEDDSVPRTAYMSEAKYPHIPVVLGTFRRFVELAAERFAVAGCRNVAALMHAGRTPEKTESYCAPLRDYDLLRDDDHIIGLSLSNPEWAARIVRLLFQKPVAERPDALLIGDDNFAEPVTLALRELGLRVPDDVMVISFANFPHPPVCHVPSLLIGYSTEDILAACLHNIDTQRQGSSPPSMTTIQPKVDKPAAQPPSILATVY